jgi:hypothetical protein
MPGVYVLKLGPLTFTLSLARWSARDSAGHPQPVLLARRERVGVEELLTVYDSLRDADSATDAELSQATGLSVEQCRLATTYLCQSGRAMVGPAGGGDRRVPSGGTLYPAAVSARHIVETGNARLTARRPIASGWKLTGSAQGEDGHRRRPLLHIDHQGRIVEATCTCPQYRRDHLTQGPCEHILALQLIHVQRATSN